MTAINNILTLDINKMVGSQGDAKIALKDEAKQAIGSVVRSALQNPQVISTLASLGNNYTIVAYSNGSIFAKNKNNNRMIPLAAKVATVAKTISVNAPPVPQDSRAEAAVEDQDSPCEADLEEPLTRVEIPATRTESLLKDKRVAKLERRNKKLGERLHNKYISNSRVLKVAVGVTTVACAITAAVLFPEQAKQLADGAKALISPITESIPSEAKVAAALQNGWEVVSGTVCGVASSILGAYNSAKDAAYDYAERSAGRQYNAPLASTTGSISFPTGVYSSRPSIHLMPQGLFQPSIGLGSALSAGSLQSSTVTMVNGSSIPSCSSFF